jgi:hypothetical protein
MGGASLWAQTVTIIPGGLTEFMLGDGRQCQLDDQDLGGTGIVPTCAHFKAVDGWRAARLPLILPWFSLSGTAQAQRRHVAVEEGSMESG